jgi:hypothetical protein
MMGMLTEEFANGLCEEDPTCLKVGFGRMREGMRR